MVYRTTPKMAQRKALRRRQILDAAIRLFGQNGYHRTTVPMIVQSASSSTGSFYNYFENKQDVFVAVIEAVGEALSQRLNEAIGQHTSTERQLQAAVKELFLYLAQNPHAARILVTESASLGGRIGAARQEILDSHVRSVTKALSALVGGPSGKQLEVAAWCWVGAVHEAATRWLAASERKRPSAADMAQFLAQFNLRAVGVGVDQD